MSSLSENIYLLLKKLFPDSTIVSEYYIKYKGQKLFFDFYIKQYNILFEIQGRQHYEFVKHFHGDSNGFLSSKYRDNLKLCYSDEYEIPIVFIKYDEELTDKDLLRKIIEAQNDRYNNKK